LGFYQLYGPTKPIPNLSVTSDLTLTALPTGGFITITEANFAGIPVTAAASITQQQGVLATLTSVYPTVKQVKPLVEALFGKQQQLSQTLMNFMQTMQFSKVTIAYAKPASSTGIAAAAADTAGAFALMATPSIDGAPKLKQMANALGLGVTDFALSSSGSNLNLGMVRPFELQLPPPFTQSGQLLLSLNQDKAVLEAVLTGTLPAAIKLPGIAAAVHLQLTADVSLRKPLNAASGSSDSAFVQLSSLVTRPLAFDKFNFVQFGDVRLAGAAIGSSTSLSKLAMSAPVTVFGVEAPASFVYDRWVHIQNVGLYSQTLQWP
jgi:hypothetical protein